MPPVRATSISSPLSALSGGAVPVPIALCVTFLLGLKVASSIFSPASELMKVQPIYFFLFVQIYFIFKIMCICMGGGDMGVYACQCKCLRSPEEGTGYFGAGTIGSFKSPTTGCWEPILCSLKEQYRILITVPSLQPHNLFDFLMVPKVTPFSGKHTLNLEFGSLPRLALCSVSLSGVAG